MLVETETFYRCAFPHQADCQTNSDHDPISHSNKVHTHKEYHSVCPLVRIGTIPPPLSPASVPLPPVSKGGGAHSRAGEGLGEFQFKRLEKKLGTRPTLWSFHFPIPFWSWWMFNWLMTTSTFLSSPVTIYKSIDLYRTELPRCRMIWLLPHPLPPPSPVSMLYRRHRGKTPRKRDNLQKGREWGRCLVLYKSFITLPLTVHHSDDRSFGIFSLEATELVFVDVYGLLGIDSRNRVHMKNLFWRGHGTWAPRFHTYFVIDSRNRFFTP